MITKDIRIKRCLDEDMTFDLFRSEVCHMLREWGDVEFSEIVLVNNMIEHLWNKGWLAKSFYFLSILDYLADKYKIPYLEAYDNIRSKKLSEPLFPLDVILLDKLNGVQKQKALDECSKSEVGRYFVSHNIIERDINDVI